MKTNQAIKTDAELRVYIKQQQAKQAFKHEAQARMLVNANSKITKHTLKALFFFINFFDLKGIKK